MSKKEQIARKLVKRYMCWSAGGALIPIPVADMAVITGAQLKMVAGLSKIYDIPFEKVRVKAIFGSLMSFVIHPAVSSGMLGFMLSKIVGVGVVVGTPALILFEAAYTWALGRVFIQHFESGGTFLDFEPDTVKQYFREKFAEGRKMVATLGTGEKAGS